MTKAKTFGTGVNVYSYTSSNQFTAPNDGVIYLNGGNYGAFIRGAIDGVYFCNPAGVSPYAGSSITPIKKGQKYYTVVPGSGNQQAIYYPYV